jgi:hypothetical protein
MTVTLVQILITKIITFHASMMRKKWIQRVFTLRKRRCLTSFGLEKINHRGFKAKEVLLEFITLHRENANEEKSKFM